MAASAAAAAALTGRPPPYASVVTPKGWLAAAEVEPVSCDAGKCAECAVRKDAGDDADATDGIRIRARVELSAGGGGGVSVEIRGGDGVGTVTRPGLDRGVGESAINSVPRRMISECVGKVLGEGGFSGAAMVTVSADGGEEIAGRTLNPSLGIVGGISILGTSGVVEPMSEAALAESVRVEMRVAAAAGSAVVVTPGNYGSDFASSRPEYAGLPVVRCSNFVGVALDAAAELGVGKVVLVGHAGKFVKVAGGIWDTHSRTADCRMEIIAAHAALVASDRLDPSDYARILGSATVDAALDVLDETGSSRAVFASIRRAAMRRVASRLGGRKGAPSFDFVMFTNTRGIL